ncbi:MAG: lipoprotein insertase outer membrane protein LolB [Rudaea sp.]
MSIGIATRAGLLLCLVVLAACAPLRVRQNPQSLAAQVTREKALSTLTHWKLTAHIGVSDGHDGGSGQLEWRQDGDHFSFVVHAPVTGRTWKLSGDNAHAVLEGVDPQPDTGSDAQRLLKQRLGWDVPLHELAAWVRGVRAGTGEATLVFDAQNLPAVLDQGDWKVEYRGWFADRTPPLPRKLFASKGNAHVRMVIESWSFDD